MSLVSGFNVYPNEIEDVVAMMPGVLEVAAVGVPDEKSGEAVKVVIVKKDPALTEAQVLEHARANLTGYKRPRSEEHTSELQSLMRISYAVFCLKKKNTHIKQTTKNRYRDNRKDIDKNKPSTSK